MSNLLPALFQYMARRSGAAAFPPERRLFTAGSEETAWEAELEQDEAMDVILALVEPVLTPQPFAEWLQGAPGLPVLTATEVAEFLRDAERVSGFSPAGGGWYELRRLEDGMYVLFANESSDTVALEVLVPVQTAMHTVQLRRSRLAEATDSDPGRFLGSLTRASASILRKPCVLKAERRARDLPYRGACETIACSSTCLPLLVIELETGNYQLSDCNCE